MPRKPIVRSNEHFYHITARSNNKDFFYIPMNEMWHICTEELIFIEKHFEVEIASFVLMNNHFHLMIKTPNTPIDEVMFYFMMRTTKAIQKLSGRINKIYGSRYRGSVITTQEYLFHAYKYIYLNPVKENIVPLAEEYPYSTLFYKIHCLERLNFNLAPIIDEHFIDQKEYLSWINIEYTKEEYENLKSAMKKSVFQFLKDRNSGKELRPNLGLCFNTMFT